MEDKLYDIEKLYKELKISNETMIVRKDIHTGNLNNKLHSQFSAIQAKDTKLTVTKSTSQIEHK